jgi:hypothetical protein
MSECGMELTEKVAQGTATEKEDIMPIRTKNAVKHYNSCGNFVYN